MKVMVIGSRGQLGNEIKKLAPKSGMEFVFPDSISGLYDGEIESLIERERPGAVINCMAYTDVCKAQDEPDAAMELNGHIPGIIARACTDVGARFIHFSTDYVFDGKSSTPYRENDKTNPLNVYGESKLYGEQMAIQGNPGALIIRTSWLYSRYGHNFVRNILDKSKTYSSFPVVSDQIGTTTNASDLAGFVMSILDKKISGILNYSNEGVASWYDFAVAIRRETKFKCDIVPVETTESGIVRPSYTVLSKEKARKFGSIPHWEDSLIEFLRGET